MLLMDSFTRNGCLYLKPCYIHICICHFTSLDGFGHLKFCVILLEKKPRLSNFLVNPRPPYFVLRFMRNFQRVFEKSHIFLAEQAFKNSESFCGKLNKSVW
jgi:hypothetical protein